jgi:hypothetical protein
MRLVVSLKLFWREKIPLLSVVYSDIRGLPNDPQNWGYLSLLGDFIVFQPISQ